MDSVLEELTDVLKSWDRGELNNVEVVYRTWDILSREGYLTSNIQSEIKNAVPQIRPQLEEDMLTIHEVRCA